MEHRDTISESQGSIIQHGAYNDRIYVIKLAPSPPPTYPYDLIDMAEENGYSKIFAKIPECHAEMFLDADFLEEARIPAFYSGREASVFMGFYLDPDRAKEPDLDRVEEIIGIAFRKNNVKSTRRLEINPVIRECNETDAAALADIYRGVFPTYPFPIHDPGYIRETMKNNVCYFGIETDGRLVAVSSAEMDQKEANVEMTDFATIPEWRGNGYAECLLSEMECVMKNKGIKTAYTIARAMSAGMNVTFSKAGYQYGGRLKNNTNISGKIESMNVWYKSLIGERDISVGQGEVI